MFSEYVAPVLALSLLGAGMIWFCEQRAKRYQPEDKNMDHQQLHALMSCAPDVRLTSAQAGELIAEFNRIKMHLNDAMDRNAQLHVEAEQARRVANDEAQKVRLLTELLERWLNDPDTYPADEKLIDDTKKELARAKGE
jgi:regulator of replication initiation timing